MSEGGQRGDHMARSGALSGPHRHAGRAAPPSSPPAGTEWRNARGAAGACLKAFKDSGRKGQHKAMGTVDAMQPGG